MTAARRNRDGIVPRAGGKLRNRNGSGADDVLASAESMRGVLEMYRSSQRAALTEIAARATRFEHSQPVSPGSSTLPPSVGRPEGELQPERSNVTEIRLLRRDKRPTHWSP